MHGEQRVTETMSKDHVHTIIKKKQLHLSKYKKNKITHKLKTVITK